MDDEFKSEDEIEVSDDAADDDVGESESEIGDVGGVRSENLRRTKGESSASTCRA